MDASNGCDRGDMGVLWGLYRDVLGVPIVRIIGFSCHFLGETTISNPGKVAVGNLKLAKKP